MNDFLKGYFQSLFAPMLRKAGAWATRQAEGTARAGRDLAQNAALIELGVNAGATALAGAISPGADKLLGKLAAQKDVQKLAAVLGIPSTSQAVLGLTLDAVDAHPTLNLGDKAALKLFLASRILPGG